MLRCTMTSKGQVTIPAAQMQAEGATTVFTFARHFDCFPSLRRRRPRDA